MSDTPRTDAIVEAVCPEPTEFVDFARELERENAKLRAALIRISKIQWGWDGDLGAKAIAENALD